MTRFKLFFTHPLQAAFAAGVMAAVFFPLSIFVAWPVALPWALFAAAALRLELKSR